MTLHLSLAPNTPIAPRQLRHLRRTLPPHISLHSSSSFPPETTHLILYTPAPTLHFLCAAAASIPLIKPSFLENPSQPPENHALHISPESPLLPASLDALWAGRIWPVCHAFWHSRLLRTGCKPLHAHRVLILGNLRPRGQAGLAAPSTAIVRALLNAAGAQVVAAVEHRPTFAIIAPGLDPATLQPLKQLLEAHVLCLASAFLIDLIARLHADPKRYVMFEQQKNLCGPLLDKAALEKIDGVLPISSVCVGKAIDANCTLEDVASPTTPDSPLAKGRKRICTEENAAEEEASKKRKTQVKAVLSFEESGLKEEHEDGKIAMEDRKESGGSDQAKGEVAGDSAPSELKAGADEPLTPLRRSRRVRKASLKAAENQILSRKSKGSKRSVKTGRVMSQSNAERKKDHETKVDDDVIVTETKTGKVEISSDDPKKIPNKLDNAKEIPGEGKDQADPAEISPTKKRKSLGNKEKPNGQQVSSESLPETGQVTEKQALQLHHEESGSAPKQRRKAKSSRKTRSAKPFPPVQKRPRGPPEGSPCPVIDLVSSEDEGKNSVPLNGTNEQDKDRNRDGREENGNGGSVPAVPLDETIVSKVVLPVVTEHSTESEELEKAILRKRKRKTTDRSKESENASNSSGVAQVLSGLPKEPPGSDAPQEATNVGLKTEDNAPQKPSITKESSSAPEVDVTRGTLSSTRIATSSSQRKRDTESRTDHDLGSGIDAVSEFANLPTAGVPSSLRDRNILTVDDGYNFVLHVLGGEPSKSAVDAVLKFPNSDEDDNTSKTTTKTAVQSKVQSSRHTIDQSPPCDDEDERNEATEGEVLDDFANPLLGGWDLENSMLQATGVTPGSGRQTVTRTQNHRSQRRKVDIFAVPAPREPILLKNVLIPNFVLVEHAHNVPTQPGNAQDDRTCQSEVELLDWVVGAESFVGLCNDDMEMTENNSISYVRKLCLSLAESKSLLYFAGSNRRDGTDIASLTGICVRLLHSEISAEASPMLIDQLLSLRDTQIESGFDSLAVVAAAENKSTIPFRHKAVAAIWGTLIQEAEKRTGEQRAWDIFNVACWSRFESILSKSRAADKTEALQKGLSWVLEVSLVIAYSFAVRLDFYQDPPSVETTRDGWKVCPPNWQVISRCLNEFSMKTDVVSRDTTSSVKEGDRVLKEFLIQVVSHVAGRVWDVNEQLLSDVATAISGLCKLRDETCYCIKPALFVSRFQGLAQRDSDRAELANLLQTPCDCFFLLSWMFVNQGSGNAMRRAMMVMRKGASLTIASGSVGSNRIAKHHVGLILTIADNLATSGDDGEFLLCRTLTSKCPRLESITENMASRTSDDDMCWRATVDAIDARCHTLLARRKSIHTYTNWLSESIVATTQTMKKTMKERPSSVAAREALRVQDSVFANLALLTLRTMQKLASLMHSKATQEPEQSQAMVRLYVEKCAGNLQNFVSFAEDVLSQITRSPDETVSKSKGTLLQAVLMVISTEMKLLGYVSANNSGSSQVVGPGGSVVSWDDKLTSRYESIMDGKLERLLLGVLRSDIARENYEVASTMKVGASGALSELLELQGAQHRFQYTNDMKRKVENIIVQGGLDGSLQAAGGLNMQQGGREMQLRLVQNRARVEFWTCAFTGSWGFAMMQHGTLQCMVSCVVMLGASWLLGSSDDQYKESIRKLVVEVGRVKEFCLLFGEWSCSAHLLGNEGAVSDGETAGRIDSDVEGWEGVRFVESTLSSAARHWQSFQAQQLVHRMRQTLQDVLEHCNEVSGMGNVLMALSHVFRVESQLGGFRSSGTHMGWLQQWTGALTQGTQKVGRHSWRLSQRRRDELSMRVQRRIMGGLCMVDKSGRDLEARIAMVRLVKALLALSNSLDGIWDVGEQVVGGQRAERNMREWHLLVFHAAVADPLSAMSTSRTELGAVLGRFARVAEMCRSDETRLRGVRHEAVKTASRLKASRHFGLISSDVRLLTEMRRMERALGQTS